jgi:aryl-alcohol dehydrogenase-like predicted oxidoreductase
MGGGGWQYGWGPQDENDSRLAIREALDAGMNWIDTAPIYGFGQAERLVGRAVRDARPAPAVCTKAGFVWDGRGNFTRDLRPGSIRRQCDESLRRLETESIDLYQVHWPDPSTPIEDAWSAMADLQREGKIRWIGAGNLTAEQFERALRVAPMTSLQFPYSILVRDGERELLPLAARAGVGAIAYSPMQCGLLSGTMTRERITALPEDDHRRTRDEFREPLLGRVLGLVELLRDIGRAHDCTPAEVAVAWTLRHPRVAAALVGLRRPGQVRGVAGAMSLRLDAAEISAIEAFRLFDTVPS